MKSYVKFAIAAVLCLTASYAAVASIDPAFKSPVDTWLGVISLVAGVLTVFALAGFTVTFMEDI
jgi:hypothetical protein